MSERQKKQKDKKTKIQKKRQKYRNTKIQKKAKRQKRKTEAKKKRVSEHTKAGQSRKGTQGYHLNLGPPLPGQF